MDAIRKIEALDAACAKMELSLERMERNRDMWKQQCANQAQTLASKEAELVRLRGVLSGAVEVARDAHAHWDADQDAKVGKYLLALAGFNPRYDQRTDAIHAALTQPPKEPT